MNRQLLSKKLLAAALLLSLTAAGCAATGSDSMNNTEMDTMSEANGMGDTSMEGEEPMKMNANSATMINVKDTGSDKTMDQGTERIEMMPEKKDMGATTSGTGMK